MSPSSRQRLAFLAGHQNRDIVVGETARNGTTRCHPEWRVRH